MADPNHLIGLSLAAIGRAERLKAEGVAHSIECVPEGQADAPIIRILDNPGQTAVFNESPEFAAKLKLVSIVINGPGSVGLHEDSTLDASN